MYSASHIVRNELQNPESLSPATRAYFRQRQRNRLHNLVLNKFIEASKKDGLTRAKLARRMGRAPAVVTRLLQSPGNWRLDTLSDMLLAIAGEEIEAVSISPLSRPKRSHDPSQYDIAKKLETLQKNTPKPANAVIDFNKQLQLT
jgi:plasmid maintenance system antidote protein VapI